MNVEILDANEERTEVHAGVTDWDIKGDFLVLNFASGATTLIRIPEGYRVMINPAE